MEGFDEGQVDAGRLIGAIGVLSLEFLAAFGQVRQSTAEHQGALVLADQRVDNAHDTAQLLYLKCHLESPLGGVRAAAGVDEHAHRAETAELLQPCARLVRARDYVLERGRLEDDCTVALSMRAWIVLKSSSIGRPSLPDEARSSPVTAQPERLPWWDGATSTLHGWPAPLKQLRHWFSGHQAECDQKP